MIQLLPITDPLTGELIGLSFSDAPLAIYAPLMAQDICHLAGRMGLNHMPDMQDYIRLTNGHPIIGRTALHQHCSFYDFLLSDVKLSSFFT